MHISAFGFSMWRKVGSWERLTIAPGPGSLVLRSVAIEPTSVVSKVTRLMRGLEELTWIGCMAVSSLMERLSSCHGTDISNTEGIVAIWTAARRGLGDQSRCGALGRTRTRRIGPPACCDMSPHSTYTSKRRFTIAQQNMHAENRSTLPTGYLLSPAEENIPSGKVT